MRATLRITWLILSLGFLCHNVCSSNSTATTIHTVGTAASTTEGLVTSVTKVTPASSTATTVSVITSENTTPTQAITAVTATSVPNGTQTGSSTVTQTVTTSPADSMIYNGNSTKKTSFTSTAALTDSPKNMTTTIMPHSSNSTRLETSVLTEAPVVPSQNVTHVTATVAEAIRTTVQMSKAFTTTVIATASEGISQRGSTESSESTKKHNAVTTVATTTTGVSSTSLSKRTQSSASSTPDLSQLTFTIANTTTTTTITTPTTSPQLLVFTYSSKIKEEVCCFPPIKTTVEILEEVCKKLMVNFADGNCSLKYYEYHNKTVKIIFVETNGEVNASIAQQYYEEIVKLMQEQKSNKTLIAILASCVGLLIMGVIVAACASSHFKPYNENQQHLTEELQTVENGYHDNPTLEVMEVQPEMQEKKVVLNGEFNDSWIVPFDNLLKEDIPDEEDTHL